MQCLSARHPIDEERFRADLRSISGAPQRTRVLHVEDDADVRDVVAAVARDIADFEAAGSLEQARLKLEQGQFDLVLLDLGLPDGSGWQLLPSVNRLTPRPRVVIFCAQESDGGRDALADAFLVKSQTSEQQLMKTINDAVRCVAQG